MEIRKCCDCKEEKTIDNFYKYKNDYQKRCKDCTKIRNRRFKDKNPEYFVKKGKELYWSREDIKQYNSDRYQKTKDKFLKRRCKWSQSVRGRIYDLFKAIQDRSKKRNYEIDIDFNFILDKYKEQEGKCLATGLTLSLDRAIDLKVGRFNPLSPSIDRIDPNRGYTKDNIRLVCTAFNLALNKFGEDFFLNMIIKYLEKRGYKIISLDAIKPL